MGENGQLWGGVGGDVREKEQRDTWRGDEWLSVGEKPRCMNGGVGLGGEGGGGAMLERQTEVSWSMRSWHVMGHAQV